eukprot:1064658-Amphidinium_carterae.1
MNSLRSHHPMSVGWSLWLLVCARSEVLFCHCQAGDKFDLRVFGGRVSGEGGLDLAECVYVCGTSNVAGLGNIFKEVIAVFDAWDDNGDGTISAQDADACAFRKAKADNKVTASRLSTYCGNIK